MSAPGATPGPGTAVSSVPVPAAGVDEPGCPVSGDAWDVRSWALLADAAVPIRSREAASRSSDPAKAGRRVRATAGPADPVRELMHRHRELCERAVDPLEIAAGLEASGVTDRTAARFRHRDVFSLAEELFARVPRAESKGAVAAPDFRTVARPPYGTWRRICRLAVAVSLVLLPAVLTGAALALFELTAVRSDGLPAAAFLVAAAVAVVASVRLALRRVVRAAPSLPATLVACWLSGSAVLTGTSADGPAGASTDVAGSGLAVPLSLACALAPAAWCARWFAARARRKLAGSRSLDEFAAGMWPLLTGAVVLFAVAVLGVHALVGRTVGVLVQRGDGAALLTSGALSTSALGVLLFIALLLTAHGFRRAASAGLGAACLLELLALGLGTAVHSGPGTAQALACGCAAAGLLAYAYRVLTGASAHGPAYGEYRADPAHGTHGTACESRGGRGSDAASGICTDCASTENPCDEAP